ncbi:MAG TPA: two-component system sensor histidine kinase KdpD [Spongiibacteraceae bacterium]|nr:two-component system sensor histidine kinase KdpD [Spongiibacteraceae bacterium]
MIDQRPDPDRLLDRVKQAEARALRGKLKIFFGASAGVGKTYAMLNAARLLREQGLDVVIGVIETHGRAETAALLAGLEQLPLREIPYRERTLPEFDLDAALQRKPALLLVDELAHSNVAGSRHPKRWQDIEELLAAGINVFTTVNVQHIESLNDVVGGITGIRVWETVPDRIFDEADEVVIVDLPPDELLQRLQEGKVYLPQQAERAIRNFFRKGNLIALRELALRRTADRVDGEMLQYREEQSVSSLWQTRESLLVCIGPDVGGEKTIRSAARSASKLNVPWHAIYVETPQLQRLSSGARQRILKTLKLAQDLGAETATLPGSDIAATLVEYARSHNLAKIIMGRAAPRRWWMRASLAERVSRLAPDLDIAQIARGTQSAPRLLPSALAGGAAPTATNIDWPAYAISAAACCGAALIAAALQQLLAPANLIMIFLLAVVLVAVRYGRGPAILAAFLSVAAFDFFFVSPRFSLAVGDAEYLLTFAVMLTVALIIGQLTAGLKYQARVAMNREARSRALYEMSRELSAALVLEQIAAIAARFVESSFNAQAALVLTDANDQLCESVETPTAMQIDMGIAHWVFERNEAAGPGTDTLPGSAILYLPLRAPMRIRGVLAVSPSSTRWLLIPEQRRQLDIFASLIALAIERVHYVDIAQSTTVQIESERLRNSLLSALSHDLRTPLTALLGSAEYLTISKPPLSAEQRELAASMRDETLRLTALVNNLLDMSKLQAGAVRLNLQWQPLEEIIGSALAAAKHLLLGHTVVVHSTTDLPLFEFDAVLMERVLFNLLENAKKYTPPGSRIEIGAAVKGDNIEIAVDDNGPGIPIGMEEDVFKKFTRGQKESATPGVGLGLAICRAIVEAHRGRIWAEKSPLGGARFVVALPCGEPPSIDESHLPTAAEH